MRGLCTFGMGKRTMEGTLDRGHDRQDEDGCFWVAASKGATSFTTRGWFLSVHPSAHASVHPSVHPSIQPTVRLVGTFRDLEGLRKVLEGLKDFSLPWMV